MFKKTTALILGLVMLLSVSVTGESLASGGGISLEQAVRTAKSVFDIPESYTKFDSNYHEYDGNAQWNLNWQNPKKPEQNMSRI